MTRKLIKKEIRVVVAINILIDNKDCDYHIACQRKGSSFLSTST